MSFFPPWCFCRGLMCKNKVIYVPVCYTGAYPELESHLQWSYSLLLMKPTCSLETIDLYLVSLWKMSGTAVATEGSRFKIKVIEKWQPDQQSIQVYMLTIFIPTGWTFAWASRIALLLMNIVHAESLQDQPLISVWKIMYFMSFISHFLFCL